MIFLTILVFLLVLGVLIFGHEFGHFMAAKLSNVKVLEFAFGFPPRLFSKIKNGTRYSLNLLPIGGYVKLLGEEKESEVQNSFSQQGPIKKLIIVAAGVVMNFLLAIIFFWISFMLGVTPFLSKAESYNGQVSPRLFVSQVIADSAANRAGIARGDLILGFSEPADFAAFSKKNAGGEIELNLISKRQTKTLSVVLDAQSDTPLGVGVLPFSKVKLNFFDALIAAVKEAALMVWLTLKFVGTFLAELFQKGKLAPEVGGPVAIFVIIKETLNFEASLLIETVAAISANLALINILPFPALDGSRFAFLFAEVFTKKRVLAVKIENIIHSIGLILLLILLLAITYRDIVRFIVK